MITKEQIQQVESIEGVVEITTTPDRILIRTSCITMYGVPLGVYRIELYPKKASCSERILIYNETKTVIIPKHILNRLDNGRPMGEVFHHPHSWIGTAGHMNLCLGNIHDGILYLLGIEEIVPLITILLEFLRNGYGWSKVPCKEFLSYWEEEKLRAG